MEFNKDQGRATDSQGNNPVVQPQGNGMKEKGKIGDE
jgi:hypothetical protein